MATSTANTFIPSSKSLNKPSFSSYQSKFPAPPTTTISLSFKSKSPSITITKQKTSKLCKAFSEETEDPPPQQQPKQLKLTESWREIHGENNWVGLLDPMDPLLRSELIRYGEIAQSCYDAFDQDPYSKYCGSCMYTRQELFNSLEMHDIGYTITRYLYATVANTNLHSFFKRTRWPHKMWSKNANWMGYVAVSDDETSKRLGRRDIVIAWRGTVTEFDWDIVINSLIPVSSKKIVCPEKSVQVDSGLLDLYTNKEESCVFCKYSAREQVLVEVKRLIEKYCDEEKMSITVTGHSLGSALGILSGYDIAETRLNVVGDRHVPVSVFSFAGWKVGNARFKERLKLLGVKVLRVVNVHDVVTKVPGLILNKKNVDGSGGESLSTYLHVGEELTLDHKDSPFLNSDSGDVHSHKLEAHLHLLDGYQGKGQKFILANGRDPVLVNKDSDFLYDHFMVPPFWWREKNKGMTKTKDGYWVPVERSKFEGHPKDIVDHLKQLGLA